jgi:DNA-binding transcriptional ArsR family regulator
MRRDAFHAIADPTRRDILFLLKNRELNINAVAEKFEISRPAISKQMKILEECGLVIIHQRGRERYCEARMEKLTEVSTWIEKYKDFWNNKLDALEDFLNSQND